MQWGKSVNNAANSVLWGVTNVRKTANSTNQTNFYGNVTPGAWTDSHGTNVMKEIDGQFGVTPAQIANTQGEGKKVGHSGWQIRKQGTGPVIGATVVAGGVSFTNTDIVKFGNSTINAVGTPVTNSIGGIVSITIGTTSKLFTNTAGAGASVVNSTGGSTGNGIASATASVGGTGYNNTDVWTFSNGVVNATANPVTNSTGGIVSLTMLTLGKGFSNNTNTVKAVANSTGGSSAGSGATIVVTVGAANIQAVLGGRVGRVEYETLVAMGSTTGTSANTTILPG
jgi:hypothetical protein